MMASKPKPMGPIPPYFVRDLLPGADGYLRIAGQRAVDLVAPHDGPVFVYDFGIIQQRVAALRAAMPVQLALHFAIKANPLPDLLAAMAPLVDGFDVASSGELATAMAAGMTPDHISFAGPGKRDSELRAAIAAGATLNLESAGEADRALAAASDLGIVPRLAVRVNPDFDVKGSGMRMGGGAKPFGVDADQVPALVRRIIAAGADWRGFHIFAGSQALDADNLIETQRQTLALAARLADESGASPALINLGGGFGVPYFAGDAAVDIDRIGAALGAELAQLPAALANTQFATELGRWFVAEAGVYLCRVVDRKISHGATYLVTDGGLHHQLAATGNFGTVIRRNYPLCVANKMRAEATETVQVVGCLCTPIDRLGDNIALPRADVGDVIAIFLAGAYGASASPARFLGHPDAAEILLGV